MKDISADNIKELLGPVLSEVYDGLDRTAQEMVVGAASIAYVKGQADQVYEDRQLLTRAFGQTPSKQKQQEGE
jgi:hypothetical protein